MLNQEVVKDLILLFPVQKRHWRQYIAVNLLGLLQVELMRYSEEASGAVTRIVVRRTSTPEILETFTLFF